MRPSSRNLLFIYEKWNKRTMEIFQNGQNMSILVQKKKNMSILLGVSSTTPVNQQYHQHLFAMFYSNNQASTNQ